MKRKLFIICILCLISISTSAQDIVKDFFRSQQAIENQDSTRVGRDSIPFIAPIKPNVATNHDLICSVSPGLYVLRQQYQLKDIKKNSFHGKNSLNYFGETFSVAVKINKGLLITRMGRIPWDYDTDFKTVNNRGKRGQYQPVLFDSYLRNLDSDEYRKYLIEDRYVNTMVDSLLYDFDDGNRDFGLQIDNTCGKKKGTLIICHADESLYKNNAAKVELSAVPYGFDVVSKDNTIFNAPDMPQDNIIGGVFVLPKIEQIGQINYYLAGVLVFTPAGEWKICSTATVFDDALEAQESQKQ